MNHDFENVSLLDINHFANLFALCFADEEKNGRMLAMIPYDYMRRIELLMYQDLEVIRSFDQIIEFKWFYNHKIEWLKYFNNYFTKFIKNTTQSYFVDCQFSNIHVTYDKEKYDCLLSEYDEDIITLMHTFIKMLKDDSIINDYQNNIIVKSRAYEVNKKNTFIHNHIMKLVGSIMECYPQSSIGRKLSRKVREKKN